MSNAQILTKGVTFSVSTLLKKENVTTNLKQLLPILEGVLVPGNCDAELKLK